MAPTTSSPALELILQKLMENQQTMQAEQLRNQEQMSELFKKFAEKTTVQNSTTGTPTEQNGKALPLPDIDYFVADTEDTQKFDRWLPRFELAVDCGSPNVDNSTKVKFLLTKLSTYVFDEYSKYTLPKSVNDLDYHETIAALRKMLTSKRSVFLDRFETLRFNKEEGEDFTCYVNRLKSSLHRFKFKELNEEQFKGLILLSSMRSSNDELLRVRILNKLHKDGDDVKFDEIIDECERYLTNRTDVKDFESNPFKINAVQNSKIVKFKNSNKIKNTAPQNLGRPVQKSKGKDPPYPCYRCGALHWIRDCPHVNSTCRKCNRRGHIERACQPRKPIQRINHVLVSSIQVNAFSKLPSNLLKTTILINNVPIPFIVDTGSEVTLINESTYRKIGTPPITTCTEQSRAYDGTIIPFRGTCTATINYNNQTVEQKIYRAKEGALNLLSTDFLDTFGLLAPFRSMFSGQLSSTPAQTITGQKIVNSTNVTLALERKFPDVFAPGLGHCTKVKASFYLQPEASPVYCRARPVPYSTKETVDKEIDRLLNMGVIKPVEHSEWAAPILVIRKANGTTRLCVDYSTGLNNALLPNQHPLPLPEDIYTTLNGGRIFSQLDLSDAYLQVELDDQAKLLCTMNTHRGLFQYQRLTFGVKAAPGIFQTLMDQLLAGLPFAIAYLDDIVVVSKTEQEHTVHLDQVFTRIQDFGLESGFIIDKDGRRPDPAKIQAISKMPPPSDVAQLRSFLGMINYYQVFVNKMRFIRQPLDDMLRNDVKWKWTDTEQKAFTDIKAILQSDLLLTHYDPNLNIIVAADASEYGIGAVIQHKFQDGKVRAIMHASHALTPAERNYGQIEKEGLALTYAVKKFHKMIFGRKFTLLTDHQPLLKIFGNKTGVPVHTQRRLQRWAITLLAYDFQIQYQKTTEFGRADALSRLISSQPTEDNDVVISALQTASNLHDALLNIPATYETLRIAVQKDDLINKVKVFVNNNWKNYTNKFSNSYRTELNAFYRSRNVLSTEQDCLMFGDRVVIPKALRNQTLQLLHRGHPGISNMKNLARQHVYWPHIDNDIEGLVKSCRSCSEAAKLPTKSTLHSWPKTSKPWQRIHIDYAGPLNGHYYLVIIDSFSKYPEVFSMNATTTTATIDKLRYVFSRHGLPETLVSDNGTQFSSHLFKTFCTENGIEHIFSPPYHPQSNGQAERFVDTLKRALTKLKGEETVNDSLNIFLHTYRTTPNRQVPEQKSPAEALLGRKIRTSLDLLRPPTYHTGPRDLPMERQFNRHHGAIHRSFNVHDSVYARLTISKIWQPGIIVKANGVLYHVKLNDNRIRRFHVNQLRPRTSNPMSKQISLLNEEFDVSPSTATLNNNTARTPIIAEQNPPEIPPITSENPLPECSPAVSVSSPAVRRSTRIRHQPRRLLMNPKNKTYDFV